MTEPEYSFDMLVDLEEPCRCVMGCDLCRDTHWQPTAMGRRLIEFLERRGVKFSYPDEEPQQ